MVYEETVKVDRALIARVNRLLNLDNLEDMTDEELRKAGAQDCDNIPIFDATFDNDARMTLHVVSGFSYYYDDLGLILLDGEYGPLLDSDYEVSESITVNYDDDTYVVRLDVGMSLSNPELSLTCCDEICKVNNEFGEGWEFEFELWFDVDAYFGTDTKDDDDKWVNFYVLYTKEAEMKAYYTLDSSKSTETHEWFLTPEEKARLFSIMNDYAKEKEGKALPDLICLVLEKKSETVSDEKSYIWQVGICSSDEDGVNLYRVQGTKEQIKKYLLSRVNTDRDANPDGWDYGTESLDEIAKNSDSEFYAYGSYDGYHIDYSAKIETEPTIISL